MSEKKVPYFMISILFIGAFISILNNTLLNIALPTIMNEFSISPSTAQWLITGYMLTSGVLIPASAFLVTRFTNRKLFIVAMGLFTLGTATAMLAPSFAVLLTGRFLQAAGSAVMMPLLMNVMLLAFPVERRGAAMGVFGMVMIVAPAIGPTLSGWVIEHYTWRTLFTIILPFAVLSLVLGIFKLQNITPNRKVSLDVLSVLLSSVGFGGILYGFSSAGGDKGWGAPEVYSTIIIGTIALAWFIVRQLKLEEPLLNLSVYRYNMFTLSSIIVSVISMAMFSGMILTPLYVQTVRGISPFDAGLLMLPGAIIMGLMSPITGRIFDKYGAKLLAVTGITIMVITTYLLSTLKIDTSYYYIMAVYTTRMFGMSMVMMPISTNGLNQLPRELNPHGAAINNTLQQVTGAIGTALLLTIMHNRTESTMVNLVTDATKAGMQMTAELQAKLGIEAMLDAINYSFYISTWIAAVALVLAFFVKRVTPPTSLAKK